MDKPDYCTNSEYADCWDCPLMHRGRDCHDKGILQRTAGSKVTAKKSEASRRNGMLGGRPPKKKEK